MAHFALCARDSMHKPSFASGNPTITTKPAEQTTEAMTAQLGEIQNKNLKQYRRKSKKPQYKPFDHTAIGDPLAVTPVEGHRSWSAQQAEFPHQISGPRPRANAGSRVLKATPPKSVEPSPSNPTYPARDNTKKGRQKRSQRNYKRIPNTSAKPDNMAGPPDPKYIPPHLRKPTITPTSTLSKPDVKLGDHIVVQSPAISTASDVGKHAQTQSPVTGTAKTQVPPSPPTTVEQKAEDVAHQDSGPTFQHKSSPVLPPVTEKERRKLDPYEMYNEQSGFGHGNGKPKIDEWALYEQTGYIQPQSKFPPASLKDGNPRWPRHQNDRSKRYPWPKAREMKPLPSDAQSGGGVDVRSDSDGDPFYDIRKIVDWNGEFLPPPECWAERVRYTNRHPGQEIVQWMDAVPKSCNMTMEINTPAFTSGPLDEKATIANREIAPKCWIPDKIEGEPARVFVDKLPSRAPRALSDMCTSDSPRPYWDRYDGCPGNCFLEALPVPEAKIDEADPENELESPFALMSTTDRLKKIEERQEKRERRRLAKIGRPIAPDRAHPLTPDRSIHPKANIYIRPVQPADVRGIMEIYNYYVNTISTTEFDPCTEAEIRDCCDNVVKAKLPFFVAIAKSNRPKGRTGYVNERIVGYTSLNDHVDQSSMHRYTFELDLFVHPGYVRQGIGKCLLDKMLDYAHPTYPARGGYEYVNDFEYLKTGERRVVKTILMSHHYENGADVSWVSQYLKFFGFSRAGNFHYIGYKHGKVVDKVMFQLHTSEKINPSVPPTVSRVR